MPPPSYTEATDTSCIEPPVVVPVVSPDENEAPPSYEEAIEDSQHSISDVEMSERQPGWLWFKNKSLSDWKSQIQYVIWFVVTHNLFSVYCNVKWVNHK